MRLRTKHSNSRVVRLATALALLAVGATAVIAADEGPRRKPGTAFVLKRTQVDQGSEAAAKEYYREVLSPQTGFLTPDTILASSLQDLLTYFGQDGVRPSDLHGATSEELMSRGADGEILASRFFAPKVTSVQTPSPALPASGFGWRKLVRFKARAGSPAAQNDMPYLYVLQNVFLKSATGDPFTGDVASLNNQVILVRGSGPFSSSKRSMYFMVYGPLVKVDADNKPIRDGSGKFEDDAKLILLLNATFDGRDPETGLEPKQYFVPDSCAQCHGRSNRRLKLNLLDTDHWFDRVDPAYGVEEGGLYRAEDFTELCKSPHGVLYDGGRNPESEEYKRAFDVIRKFNSEIRDQNEKAGGGFALEATEKWLELHKTSAGHVPPYQRGFGEKPWDPNNSTHRRLLYFLNRYCYRCHSSIRFNVFKRDEVQARVGQIRDRLLELEEQSFWMPQDRPVPGLEEDPQTGHGVATGDLKIFLELLKKLENESN